MQKLGQMNKPPFDLQPETTFNFSIRKMNVKDLSNACDIIECHTLCQMRDIVEIALECDSEELYNAACNALAYFAFKTVLSLRAENKHLKAKLLRFNT